MRALKFIAVIVGLLLIAAMANFPIGSVEIVVGVLFALFVVFGRRGASKAKTIKS